MDIPGWASRKLFGCSEEQLEARVLSWILYGTPDGGDALAVLQERQRQDWLRRDDKECRGRHYQRRKLLAKINRQIELAGNTRKH